MRTAKRRYGLRERFDDQYFSKPWSRAAAGFCHANPPIGISTPTGCCGWCTGDRWVANDVTNGMIWPCAPVWP